MRSLLVLAGAALALGRAAPAQGANRPAHVTFYFGLERPEDAARAASWTVGSPSSNCLSATEDAGGRPLGPQVAW